VCDFVNQAGPEWYLVVLVAVALPEEEEVLNQHFAVIEIVAVQRHHLAVVAQMDVRTTGQQ
jgi:hypothetical protein